jgi:hypothetical protein
VGPLARAKKGLKGKAIPFHMAEAERPAGERVEVASTSSVERPDSAPSTAQAEEDYVLQNLGLAFLVAGVILLVYAASELGNIVPPTYGHLTNVLIGGGLGLVFAVTGFYYYTVGRNDAGLILREDALSLSQEPETGAREWIRFDDIVKLRLVPWIMSPWVKRTHYVELELEAKKGDVACKDTFISRLPDDPRAFLEQLRSRLADRFQLVGNVDKFYRHL